MKRSINLLVTFAVFAAGLGFGQVMRFPSVAAYQGNCRTFPETGKQVCGQFLIYWESHGGLAQQGLPLSGEFTEVNDLDGKPYTVQYFERAVFEKHPENRSPFDVLLSQLGTFQFKRKYPNGEPTGGPPPPPPPTPRSSGGQELTGSGEKVSDPIALKKGLAVFHSVHLNGERNFIVELVDLQGRTIALLANEIGPADTYDAARIPADGNYLLKVKADADWRITITQPTGTYSAPPNHQEWKGHGSFVTAVFPLKAGAARFKASHTNGTRNFIVELVALDGSTMELLANEIGPANIDTIENIRANSVFVLAIKADGDWVITVDQ
jgi:hypothetical protein